MWREMEFESPKNTIPSVITDLNWESFLKTLKNSVLIKCVESLAKVATHDKQQVFRLIFPNYTWPHYILFLFLSYFS